MARQRAGRTTPSPSLRGVMAMVVGLLVAGSAMAQNCQNCVWPGVNATISPTPVVQTASGAVANAGRYTFAVDVCINNTYRFSLCPADTGSTTISDSWMCLFAPACTLLLGSNDDACGLNSAIDFTPTVNGLHILQIEPRNLGNGGNFTLAYWEVSGPGCGAACTTSFDCDDGLFCNGPEQCNGNRCQSGTPPNCDDNDACTADVCDDNFARCDNIFADSIAPDLTCSAVTPLHGGPPARTSDLTAQRISDTVVIPRVNAPIVPLPEDAKQTSNKNALINQQRTQFDGRNPQFLSEPNRALSCASPCSGFTTLTEVSNDWYHVAITCSDGAFTARSGDLHPLTAAAGNNVGIIFGGSGLGPGTSDLTFRVHNNNTSYLNPTAGLGCAFNPPDTPSEPNNIGLEVEWTRNPMPGLDIILREEVVAFGDSVNNSGVRLTMCVESLPSSTVVANMGVRWQVDHWQVEDGPVWSTVQCEPFDISPDLAQETLFLPADLRDFYRAVNNTGTPVFADFMNTIPLSGFPGTVIPDRVIYGRWSALSGSAWNYAANPANNGDADSAVLYYIGYDPADGFLVNPGTRECRSMIMFSSVPSGSCLDFEPGADGEVTICEGDSATIGATGTDLCSVPSVTLGGSTAGSPTCNQNPCQVVFPTAGTYVYDWDAQDPSGNSAACQTTVNVIPSPVAVAGSDIAVCVNDSVLLDGSGSIDAGCPNGMVFEWRDITGTVVSNSPTWTPPTGSGGLATYTLAVLCVGTPACERTDNVDVLVVPPPTAAAGADFLVCVDDVVTLDGTGSLDAGCPSGLSYSWTDSIGTVVATTATWTAPTGTPGTTTYTLEVSCAGAPSCPTTDQVDVVVIEEPVSDAGTDFTVCEGEPVVLSGINSTGDAGCPGGLQYLWTNGAGTTVFNGPVWSPPTTTAGTETYTLEARCAGLQTCSSTDQAIVTVVAAPVSNAGPDVLGICRGTSITLDGSGSADLGCPNGVSYTWMQGAMVVGSGPTFDPPTGGAGNTTYTLVVSCIGPPGCTDSDQVLVSVTVCLPVVWDSYGARWSNQTRRPVLEIYWSTLLEEGTTAFVVERADSPGSSFAMIGQPMAAQGPGFNYRFQDDSVAADEEPWYRIVEYTVDGPGDVTPEFTIDRTPGKN